MLEKTPPTHKDTASLERAHRNAVRKGHGEIVKQLALFVGEMVAGRVLGFALKNLSAEVVQILLDVGARLDHVGFYLLSELFESETGKAQKGCHELFEASLRCELLICAFPDLREHYM